MHLLHTFSPLFTSVNAQCIQGFVLFILSVIVVKYIAFVASMSEGHSCSGAVFVRKCTSCKLNLKLDIHLLQKGEHKITIAHPLQVLETTVHTILKNAQETETEALN
jgi:hypothetical protein